jgi:hypothetical protein
MIRRILMEAVKRLSMSELEAGMEYLHRSPKDKGLRKMIVRRPDIDEREVLAQGELDLAEGLLGDNWRTRGSRHTTDGSPNIQAQITIMNSRAIELLAQDEKRWPLAGDQLYIDMDLSDENLPPGTRLAIGSAVIEVSAVPHTGCKKFAERFGTDATKFVNSREGKRLHLRGIHARIIQPGEIHAGDAVRKINGTPEQ